MRSSEKSLHQTPDGFCGSDLLQQRGTEINMDLGEQPHKLTPEDPGNLFSRATKLHKNNCIILRK